MAPSKDALRNSLKADRRRLCPKAGSEEAWAAATSALKHLCRYLLTHRGNSPDDASAQPALGFYRAMDHEFDPLPLEEAARKGGATVALPRVDQENGLQFHLVNQGTVLQRGALSVMEPTTDLPLAGPIDAFFVPGLGFDQDGYRIGYGKGHYDRTLRSYPDALRIGLLYSEQLIAHLPRDYHDEPVDLLLSPLECHPTSRRPLEALHSKLATLDVFVRRSAPCPLP